MKAFFDLTPVELDLMEMFWNADKPLSFKEIMTHVNSTLEKGWKKQTLNTYLSNMQKVGLVRAEQGDVYYRYSAAHTKEEYIQQWTQKLVKNSYGDSISNFVAAFTGGKKLSEEEAERLRKLL